MTPDNVSCHENGTLHLAAHAIIDVTSSLVYFKLRFETVHAQCMCNYIPKRRYIPVSYTHLRAHETVLDLVCRLLLEKKNKTRTACLY